MILKIINDRERMIVEEIMREARNVNVVWQELIKLM